MSELHKGDMVVMTDKYYESKEYPNKIWIVASEPWNVCGTQVVCLEGFQGGYAADGLRKVKHE